MDGKGNSKIGKKEKIPDLTSPTWQAQTSDEQIRKVINEGTEKNPKMKGFKDFFSQAEIDSLVPYVRSLNAK